MMNDAAGPILAKIAAGLAHVAGPGPGDAFLYAEAHEEWVAPSIFKELDDRVAYRDVQGSDDIWEDILDLWYSESPDRKWNALVMTVSGTTFDARFLYSEGWDEAEDEIIRRGRLLKAKFGDKPVVYPDD
jgi:hypothetical protein